MNCVTKSQILISQLWQSWMKANNLQRSWLLAEHGPWIVDGRQKKQGKKQQFPVASVIGSVWIMNSPFFLFCVDESEWVIAGQQSMAHVHRENHLKSFSAPTQNATFVSKTPRSSGQTEKQFAQGVPTAHGGPALWQPSTLLLMAAIWWPHVLDIPRIELLNFEI